MADPLADIEDRQGHQDTGRILARLYLGAKEESGSRVDALWATAAAFLAMLRNAVEIDEPAGPDEALE